MPAVDRRELCGSELDAARHAAHRRLHDVLPDRQPGRGDGRESGPGSPGLRLGRCASSACAAGCARVRRLAQAFARPYDVLLRGMATEAQGVWAERAWLFIALCRQLEIDAGLITYTQAARSSRRCRDMASTSTLTRPLYGLRRGPKSPVVWICAALIDDKAYLFDARLGLEIPDRTGRGWRRSKTPCPTRPFSSG